MPIAAKTTANCSAPPRTLAWRAICAATSLCGSPAPEKSGSCWPRTRVFSPSMPEMPVCMNSCGRSRAQADGGAGYVQTRGLLEDLDDGVALGDLDDLAAAHRLVGQVDVDDGAVGKVLGALHEEQRPRGGGFRAIPLCRQFHPRSPPLPHEPAEAGWTANACGSCRKNSVMCASNCSFGTSFSRATCSMAGRLRRSSMSMPRFSAADPSS